VKIDFNNVRRQAINSYNGVIDILNNGIRADASGYNCTKVYVEDIRDHLNDLRQAIIGIACTYEENNADFKCVLGDNETLKEFDPGL